MIVTYTTRCIPKSGIITITIVITSNNVVIVGVTIAILQVVMIRALPQTIILLYWLQQRDTTYYKKQPDSTGIINRDDEAEQ